MSVSIFKVLSTFWDVMKLKFEFECANFILADWESVKFCS